MSGTQTLQGTHPDAPDYMSCVDGDWMTYVQGHDPDELWCVDNPDDLMYEKIWMRPIRASQADDFGFFLDDDATVTRDPKTGRFKARLFWIECPEDAPGAVPYMGCRYRPEVLS